MKNFDISLTKTQSWSVPFHFHTLVHRDLTNIYSSQVTWKMALFEIEFWSNWWNFEFVETEWNEGNWNTSQRITFLQKQMAKIQPKTLLSKISPWRWFWRKIQILDGIAKSNNLKIWTWWLKSMFEGLRPSNTLFKYQFEKFKYFDFAVFSRIRNFLQNHLQSGILERSVFRWI